MSRERFIELRETSCHEKKRPISHVEIEVSVKHANKMISRQGNSGLQLRTACF